MPDSIDVGPAFARAGQGRGLWEPYKPTTWDEIPDALKDPDGNWVAAYYGIIALGTNTTIVQERAEDLRRPEEARVQGPGRPQRRSRVRPARRSPRVMAASLANGGSVDDIMPGIQFFADLKKSGNFVPTDVTEATVLSGETPIALDWTYNCARPAADS